MTSDAASGAVLVAQRLRKTFQRPTGEVVHALDDVSLEVGKGSLTAIVGPDGAGKTTLLRLAAGLLTLDAGELNVLGFDVRTQAQALQEQIGYMPQRFGLYEDLSIQENLDLYADMHGVDKEARAAIYPRLMEMTALGPFLGRLAGKLSGGMKQKLGLACALVRSPQLLLLDEPTVGVDPLSRRELWQIITGLVREQGLTVLVSTSYLEEAERCGDALVLHEGNVLARGPPGSVSALAEGRTFLADPPSDVPARVIQARLLDAPGVVDASPQAGQVRIVLTEDARPDALRLDQPLALKAVPARFEDGFMVLLQERARAAAAEPLPPAPQRANRSPSGQPEIEVRDLVRRFGDFVAVDHVSFEVRPGEIFGLLGPNGAGKTTTFRMLCGLLRPTGGTLRIAGTDVRTSSASARQKIGYVAQKFSLYGQLSVAENLDFFGRAYGLSGMHRRRRIATALHEFGLEAYRDQLSGQLPGGYRQRLAMAAALLHEPQVLFLDEATSGADPLARREFWRRITALAEGGVTIVVTTHFMAEAEYCDHLALLDSGRILAQGSPAEIRAQGRKEGAGEPTFEEAFVAIVEESRRRGPDAQAA